MKVVLLYESGLLARFMFEILKQSFSMFFYGLLGLNTISKVVLRAIKLFLVFTCCLFFQWGCTFTSHGQLRSIPQGQIDNIQINKTTKKDIVEKLGEPQQITYKPDGIEIYVYQHGLERSVGIPFIISFGRVGGGGQRLAVTFRDGVVVYYEYTIDQRNILK